jgi:hypothetical protein
VTGRVMPARAQSPQERARRAFAVRRYPPSGQGQKTPLAPSYGLAGGILALGGLIPAADFACVGALTRAKGTGIRQRGWRIGAAGLRTRKKLGRSSGTRRDSTVTRSCPAQPIGIVHENAGVTVGRAFLPFSCDRLYARVRLSHCHASEKGNGYKHLGGTHFGTATGRCHAPLGAGPERKQGVGYAARRAG